MNEVNRGAGSTNPFCTRRIRPGAIPFLFPANQSAEGLVDRLRQLGWRAQITGPHGSGKSALLASLAPAIERAGFRTALVTLHDGERRLPSRWSHDPRLQPPAVLIVDGYEQLNWWNRMVVSRFCRRRDVGLLVTSHGSVGFSQLYRTAATAELAEAIVRELMGGREPPFTPKEITDCFSRRHGDLREMLFDLYDLYAARGEKMT